jgi:prepilin-type N-terminal cleavage/methylation domain-containing protein
MKKNYLNKNIKKNQGYSLIEILIVFVIIGVALAGAFALYSKNSDTTNAKTMASDLQAVSSGVKSAFAQDANQFQDVDNTKVCQLGILTSNLISPSCTGTITNKFNGAVEIKPGSNPTNFTISEANVPPSVIVKTVSQMGTDGVLGIGINGKCIYSSGTVGSKDAAGDCDETAAKAFSAADLAKNAGTQPGTIIISYGM